MYTIESRQLNTQYLQWINDSFSFLVRTEVVYAVIAEPAYPRKLVASFLADLEAEFGRAHGSAVAQANRPYAFIKFGTETSYLWLVDNVIQKLKRSYHDTRAKENIARLQADLAVVTSLMSSNIQEVLERGTKLDQMSLLSGNLAQDSRRYMQSSRQLNLHALYRKYGMIVGGTLLVCFVMFVLVKLFF